MRTHRSSGNHLIPFFLLLIVFCSGGFRASDATEFEGLSEKYFLDRTVDYANELLLKEEYLGILYQSAVQEIRQRDKEGYQAPILRSSFWDLEPVHFDRDAPEIATASLPERYCLWRDFEEREYQRRLQTILDVRRALIESATAEQGNRQFRWELEKAMKAYGEEDWELANLVFQRLLRDYHYQQLDDILFYLSEVSIQLKYWDAALDYLFTLLSEYPASEFRARSYDRTSELLLLLGEGRDLIRLYQNYSYEGFPGDPVQMGGVHLRAARAEAAYDNYELAAMMLERVDPRSTHYLASCYLLADCLTALQDWPQAVAVLSEMVEIKQGKMPYERWRLLTDEAKIKLAFIYYEWEEFDKAADLFRQIKQNSPFYDRVLMGRAWIAFQLDDYEEAIAETEELLSLYTASTEIYEAGSLAGYCYEQLGQKTTAMGYFYDVLEAGVGRSKLLTFLKERGRIRDSLAELRALEETVFSSGDEEIFSDYKRARSLFELCMKRIGLAELLEANVQMRSLVEERVLLDQLLKEHRSLEETVVQENEASLYADFLALEDRIFVIMDHLKSAGTERLRSTPLYYKEARVTHINTVADTLSRHIDAEIETLIASIVENADLYQQALDADNPRRCIQLGLHIDALQKTLNRSYENRTLAEASHATVLKTRVDRWSDFSFNRYAMGGMEFDELERKYDRLKRVEDYIVTLDDMIETESAADSTSSETETAPQGRVSEESENNSE